MSSRSSWESVTTIVRSSISSTTSSGHALSTLSALGTRSGVATARSVAGDERLRSLDHVGFDTAAGDRADEAAVLADDHLRARLARRGTDRVDHGRDDHLLAGGARLIDHLEDIAHRSYDSAAA